VESRHDHGLSRTQQHETMGEQRVVNSLYGRYTPAHARMAKRWGHIGGKRSKPEEWRSSLRVFADPEIANTGQPRSQNATPTQHGITISGFAFVSRSGLR